MNRFIFANLIILLITIHSNIDNENTYYNAIWDEAFIPIVICREAFGIMDHDMKKPLGP